MSQMQKMSYFFLWKGGLKRMSKFQNLMEGTGIYLYIHNFDFSSNFDAFFSLNWYCPSRNKYDDHVLLNLQGHIVFMHSNCKGVYPCIKHGPFILWWSMHKRVHESSINHMIILDMVMTNQSPWPWY